MSEPGLDLAGDRDRLAALADLAQTRLGYQDHLVSVGPTTVRLRLIGERLVDRLLPAFAQLDPEPSSDQARPPRPTVVAWDMTEVGQVLPALDLLPRPDDEPRSTYVDGDRGDTIEAWFQPLESTISLYDHASSFGYYCVRSSASLPPWESAAPLRALMRWALADQDLHLVHAAAVGDHRGALLLAARGGSGKSTSTALCAAAGMLTTGDDYVVLSPSGPGGSCPTVHSLYRTLKVNSSMLEARFPTLPSRAAGHGKRSVWIDELAPRSQVPTMEVAAIVVPSVAESALTSAFQPASAAVAIRGLGPSTVLQLPGRADRALAAMAHLAHRVPVFTGQLGRDLDRVAGDLEALLGRAVAESAGMAP